MATSNIERRRMISQSWNKKSLAAILILCSLHLPRITAAEDLDPPEGSSSSNMNKESENHVAFNVAMHIVLFVLTKNFHIGAFLITVLPLISLVKMSISKHTNNDN